MSTIQECSKIYVPDTSVLLHDPEAIRSFAKDAVNLVVVPLCVLEELDRIKRDPGEKGLNARTVARMLDELRQDGRQSLKNGVQIAPEMGFILVDHDGDNVKGLCPDLAETTDNRILVIAKKWQDKVCPTNRRVAIVTKDINMRLKADSLGIPAEDYRKDKVVAWIGDLYSGRTTIEADNFAGDVFTDLARPGGGKISIDRLRNPTVLNSLFPNQCCAIESGDKYLLTVYKKTEAVFWYIPKPKRPVKDEKGTKIRPINEEQAVLDFLLRDSSIPLVTVGGKAGTGKSILAFAAGYDQFIAEKYKFLLIFKPIIEVGKETLGFYPGDLDEKMEPWAAAVFDSFNLILKDKEEGRKGVMCADDSARAIIRGFMESGGIEIAPISHVRGRSLNDAFVVVDEAQNLTPHAVKTLVTRIGKRSKMVLVGDIEQIDSPYLGPTSNGLALAIERAKDSELSAHVTLVRGERSELAELFANIL